MVFPELMNLNFSSFSCARKSIEQSVAGMFCTPKFWGFMGVQHPQIFEEKFCTPKFCTPESQMNPHIPRSARSCTPNLVVQIPHGGAKILTLPIIFERF